MKKKKLFKVVSAALSAVLLVSSVPAGALAAPALSAVLPEQKTDAGENLLKLWYDEPVSKGTTILDAGSFGTTAEDNRWQQLSLPIGNSFMGANVYGEIASERLTFNQKTLWNGGPSESRADYDGGNKETASNGKAMWEAYEDVVNAFLAGNDSTASTLCNQLVGESSGYGAYQSWGDIYLTFDGLTASTVTSNYERSLDLTTAIANVDFTADGTDYHREYFISYPDNVLAMKLTAEGSDSMSLNVSFPIDNEEGVTSKNLGKNVTYKVDAGEKTIVTAGSMQDNQMKLNSMLQVVTSGQVTAGSDDMSLDITDASEVIIFVSADTDYENNYPDYRTGETDEELAQSVAAVVEAAEKKGYDLVKESHLADYQELFSRVELDLGQAVTNMPTDDLLAAYKSGTASDAEKRLLEVLLYQYGRYLTIASSREGDLPSNLQGVWQNRVGDANRVPWGSDYHMNVNLQMNYWPTYSSNLAECAAPLIDYVDSLREPGRVTAETYFGISSENGEANGFTAHTQNTPFGWTCPGWDFSWGWSPAAVPWILQNCWEYYEYTRDEDYMREKIYPMMKEEAILYDQILVDSGVEITLEDGTKSTRLVSAPTYSPEHGPRTLGNAYEQELIWQLYEDCITAAETLGVDADLAEIWKENQSRLAPIEVGDSGQIKEWYTETTLGSMGERGHRHMSHLLGLFPGDLISVDNDTYMDAAIVSLTDRGMESTGWGMGQRINSWARTGQGNKAHQLIQTLFKKGIYPNMWDTHSPFQIDGNFGYTSGVNEMLMQSNMGYINILPALPDAWSDGSVNGIVARGNFELGIEWQNGRASSVRILSKSGGKCTVQYTGISSAVVKDSRGNAVAAEKLSRDRVSFETAEGETYTIEGFKELAAAPANVEAVNGSGGVSITWDAVAGAESYIVYRRTDSDYVKIAENVTEAAYTDKTEFDDIISVRYKISAVVAGAEGAQSDAASVAEASAGIWIDDTDASISYTGSWADWEESKNYNGTLKYDQNGVKGDTIEMSFTGTGIDIIAPKNSNYGAYVVLIDGEEAGTADCSASQSLSQQVVYSNRSLSSGAHTIKLVVNGGDTSGKIEFDAFVVYTSSDVPANRTVTFVSDRPLASGSLPEAVTQGAGTVIELPSCDARVTGYSVGGWTDGKATYATGDSFTVPSRNVTLTAVWVRADYIAIDKTGWTARAGSEENSGSDGPASYAIDGNTSTIWHSAYSSGKVQPDIANDINNEFTIDFGKDVTVGKFEYVPRSGSINGQILGYRILYSTTADGDDFTEIASGTWEANTDAKSVAFENTAMRRLQIRATATNGDSARDKFISAAEFGVYTAMNEDIVEADGVTIDSAVTLKSGESRQLNAAVTPEDATYKELTYTTSDYKLATVNDKGIVTANKLGRTGTVTITAASESGQTAVCQVTILPLEVESVSISKDMLVMKPGGTVSLTASVSPYYATERKLTWSCSDDSVISLDGGKVTALKNGTAVIWVTAQNGKKASCTVRIADDTEATDKTALENKVAEAKKTVLDGYTEESVEKFNAALSNAERVLGNEEAAQEEIDEALKALQDAQNGLVGKPDRTELQSTLDDAEKLDLSAYTDASANALRNAVTAAKAVLADPNATQAELQKALDAIKLAKAGLVKAVTPPPAAVVPAVGRTVDVNGVTYKVTRSAAINGTAAAVKLVNKKKTKITIPATVKIDGFTFKVTAVSAKVFQKSKKIKAVVIGSNVTSIGKAAFYKCGRLSSVTFKGSKAPKLGKNAFRGTASKMKLTVSKKMKKKNLNKFKSALKKAGISKKAVYKKK